MKINDIMEQVIFEADEELLDKVVDAFRSTKGEFTNASHKFYYVRKVLSGTLEANEKEAVKSITPSEFFNYMKSKKPQNKPPIEKPKEPEKPPEEKQELVAPSKKDLDNAGTVYALIYKWVKKYYKHYTVEEITDVLYDSAVGNYEDKVFIRRQVNDKIISIKNQEREEDKKRLYSEMQKKFALSSSEARNLEGSNIYDAVMKDINHDINNQPRVPGQKPQKPIKVVKYYRNQKLAQYDNRAFDAYMNGNQEDAKELVTKRDIIKNASDADILNWSPDK